MSSTHTGWHLIGVKSALRRWREPNDVLPSSWVEFVEPERIDDLEVKGVSESTLNSSRPALEERPRDGRCDWTTCPPR